MLDYLPARLSERKRRLLCVGFCRRVWHLLTDESARRAVQAAERHADGLATDDELQAACAATGSTEPLGNVVLITASAEPNPDLVASAIGPYVGSHAAREMGMLEGTDLDARFAEYAAQCDLIREVLGNPFRPVTIAPQWRTPAVVALAQVIAEDRAWEQMPILADALLDAGCDEAAILEHCRSVGSHVPGCWLLDLLLEKT
jgi:hypothetical protein